MILGRSCGAALFRGAAGPVLLPCGRERGAHVYLFAPFIASVIATVSTLTRVTRAIRSTTVSL